MYNETIIVNVRIRTHAREIFGVSSPNKILFYKLGVSYRVGDIPTISPAGSHYAILSHITSPVWDF
jgi:hypothetical protein